MIVHARVSLDAVTGAALALDALCVALGELWGGVVGDWLKSAFLTELNGQAMTNVGIWMSAGDGDRLGHEVPGVFGIAGGIAEGEVRQGIPPHLHVVDVDERRQEGQSLVLTEVGDRLAR